jgi:hypothetical protein
MVNYRKLKMMQAALLMALPAVFSESLWKAENGILERWKKL